MKTFREHIKEEITIGALASGGIDIERDAVRDEINGILSSIATRPCVTPYASLNKIRKALAYFSIFLPKKVYLEGRHGIEVWEVNQFGDKMGFTDSGEWIRNVPAKYYLFFHYHRIGSMYYLEAKIVDDKELETKISTTEKMFAEEMDASMRQDLAKAKAPKEDPHTALGDCDCSQGDSPSTKDAVKVSMKKKIEEDKDPCWKGYEMVGMKKKGGRKVPNCVPVKEEQIDELDQKTMLSYKSAAKDDRKVSKAIIKKGSDTEDKWKHAVKKRKTGLKLVKKRLGEEQIDEMKGIKSKSAYNRATKQSAAYKMRKKKQPATPRKEKTNDTTGQLQEKAPPGAKFERMVKHIKAGYAKDGLTAKEKGIAYDTAWKAKKRESKD